MDNTSGDMPPIYSESPVEEHGPGFPDVGGSHSGTYSPLSTDKAEGASDAPGLRTESR